MRAIAGLSLLLLAGCDKATEPGFAEAPEVSRHTVAYLKSLCDGRSSAAVTQDITIRGFITANDLYGEFDRTIVVEDPSGGIESPPGIPRWPTTIRSARLPPCGATADALQLRRKDRTGFRTRGLRGRSNSARGAVPLYPRHAAGGGRKTPGRPAHFRGGFGTPHRHPGPVRRRAVRRCGKNLVRHRPRNPGRTVATERTIVDAGGNEFTVRSAATCAYAKEPLPSGTGSLYGIIDYFAGKYTLRVTNREVVFSRTATPYTAHSAYQTTPDPGARERHVTVAALPRAYLSVVGCSAPRPTK